jgi:hypothetical protein
VLKQQQKQLQLMVLLLQMLHLAQLQLLPAALLRAGGTLLLQEQLQQMLRQLQV